MSNMTDPANRDEKISESNVLDFSDSEKIGLAIEKLDELTNKLETISDCKEWLSPCGNCTACYGNNDNWYEEFRRIGEDFALAQNSCYKRKLLYWKTGEEHPTTVAYYTDKWILKDDLKLLEIIEIIKEAFSQAKLYMTEQKQKNQKSMQFIEGILK